MQKVISGLVIFVCVLLSASFLKGAGVGFEKWYGAPQGISQIIVIILTMVGFVKAALYLLQLFFKNKKN
ncbi:MULTISPECIES: hypothetical protein [Winslowiella]|uniref:hypothetical protein n=1 Tax=Winslowiella TaxID=2997349 RepID=UPI0028BD8A3D|nr:hypothetical protein [Winslowiella toletana]WNN45473.1 hypothetical protein RIN69_06150 [Winslowiella toletana]